MARKPMAAAYVTIGICLAIPTVICALMILFGEWI